MPRDNLPKRPDVECLPEFGHRPVVPVLLDHKEADTGAVARIDHAVGAFEGQGHGLFHDDVRGIWHHIAGDARVRTGFGEHGDDVGLHRLHHVHVVAEGPGTARGSSFLQTLRPSVADSCQLHAREISHHFDVS